MTYAAHHGQFPHIAGHTAAPEHPAGAGFLRRIFDAVVVSRERHANELAARIIAHSGGRLTDDIERRVMRQLASSDWSPRG